MSAITIARQFLLPVNSASGPIKLALARFGGREPTLRTSAEIISMRDIKSKVLVFNWEPDALTNLRHILEFDVEATITWDNVVVRKLVKTTQFHVILAGKEGDSEPAQAKTSLFDSASANGLTQPTLRKVA